MAGWLRDRDVGATRAPVTLGPLRDDGGRVVGVRDVDVEVSPPMREPAAPRVLRQPEATAQGRDHALAAGSM